MPTTQHVYLNGRILPAEDATVSPFDVGILRGFAVFDLLETVKGRPFLLAEHLERLRASAAQIGLAVPYTDEVIAAAIDELLGLNAHEDEATIRLVLSGGVSPDGMRYDPATPTFFILTHDSFRLPAEVYTDGGKLVLHEHQREFPLAKTTSYLTWLSNHDRIDEAGAIDMLFHSGGLISEAATASFMVVKNGQIHAPGKGVLPGTIKAFALDVVKDQIEIVYRDVTLEEVLDADESFLTSTVRGVVPIVRIDDRVIADGTVGPITRQVMEAYSEAVGQRA
ncbi:MAG: aminotransferase class IV [Actinomycetota bacterium]|nr:aminotransferase class IV [Actinomycetota bacterium]